MLKETLYDWNGANAAIFYTINGLKGGDWYERLMLLGAVVGDRHYFPLYLGAMVLLALGSVWCKRKEPIIVREHDLRRWLGLMVVFAVSYIVSCVIIYGIKDLAGFPRPFVALPEGTVHIIGERMELSKYYASFPSGHAAFSMLLIASLWPLLGRVGRGIAVGFVLWVGISRMALGVHFPVDIVAGYIISLLVVIGVRALWDKIALHKGVTHAVRAVLKTIG